MWRPLPLLAILLTFSASAQTAGQLFPLTNTRYGITGARPILRSNGQELIVFGQGPDNVRATKIVDGQDRAGEIVFDSPRDFDVAWTGTRFLAVTDLDQPSHRIIGRRLDRDGRPLGNPFTILTNAREPRIAAGHGAVLLVSMTASNETRATLLAPDGGVIGTGVTIATSFARSAVTATEDGFLVVSALSDRIAVITLDAEGRIVTERAIARLSPEAVDVVAASHGNASLIVWSDYNEMMAARVASDGTPGLAMVLERTAAGSVDSLYPGRASAIWNGTGWTIGYEIGRNAPRVRVAHLDALAQHVVHREEAAANTWGASVARVGNRTVAGWTRFGWFALEPALVAELPLAEHEPREVTFGASDETFYASASSASATLVVWREERNRSWIVRVGLRTHDGQWRERILVEPTTDARTVAASDGRSFLVVVGARAFLLDDEGTSQRAAVTLPSAVDLAVWNGERYVLLFGATARTLTPSGMLSNPIPLPIDFHPIDMASDGTGLLVTGGEMECQFLLCRPVDVRAVRLTRDFARADATDLLLSVDVASLHGVVWNGSDYVVAWDGMDDTVLARIGAAAGTAPRVQHLAPSLRASTMTATSDGRIALLSGATATSQYLTFVDRDGAVSGRATIGADAGDFANGHGLEPLAGGAVAYIDAGRITTAPHYGAKRVRMSIASNAPPARPGAPRITARDDGARVTVEWTAPAGTVNGYRLEQRIDDGAWIELERWFTPGEQSTSIRKPATGSTFAFRVRALNDAGASPYSNVANAQAPRKRRSVR